MLVFTETVINVDYFQVSITNYLGCVIISYNYRQRLLRPVVSVLTVLLLCFKKTLIFYGLFIIHKRLCKMPCRGQ